MTPENEHQETKDHEELLNAESLQRRESLTPEQLAKLEPEAKAKISQHDTALITALENKFRGVEKNLLEECKIPEGRALNRLKATLPHGRFAAHCKEKWGFSESWRAQLMYLGSNAHRIDEGRVWADALSILYPYTVDGTVELLKDKHNADEKAKSGVAWAPEPKARRKPRQPGSGVQRRDTDAQLAKAANAGAPDAEDRTGFDETPGSEVPFAEDAPPTAPEDITDPEVVPDEAVPEEDSGTVSEEDSGITHYVDAGGVRDMADVMQPVSVLDFTKRLDELAGMIPNKPLVVVQQVDALKRDYEFVVKTNRSLREDLARAKASVRGFKNSYEEARKKLEQYQGVGIGVQVGP